MAARKKRAVAAPRESPAKRVREGAARRETAIIYVESSALVAAILESDTAARRALDAPGRRVTSAVTFAEARRAVVRARVSSRITAADEAMLTRDLEARSNRCELVNVTNLVLLRAGRPFPVEPVRTLDAIHLATLEVLGIAPQLVTVVTRDERVASNARALGFPVAAR